MSSFVLPSPVRPGDVIAVVAPSSPFGHDDFWRGLAWLRDRYRLLVEPSILSRDGYLAGSDDRRRAEMIRAMTLPDVRAIIAARGGYGATRIELDLPWNELVRSPRWLVGFSDITSLHVRANALGIASIHAPHVTGLGRAAPRIRAAFLRALERPAASFAWENLRVIHPGCARGVVIGGNLSMLYAMAAAGRLVVPAGAILAIEDVTERPYRVDRMLTALLSGNHLASASGIVFGSFSACEPGPDGRSISDVINERTARLGIPVFAGAPFGHEDPNEAFVLGREVRLEISSKTSGSVTF
ncbi:MAG: LD-carboxypeptidase [Polyangiaceae bacterium]